MVCFYNYYYCNAPQAQHRRPPLLARRFGASDCLDGLIGGISVFAFSGFFCFWARAFERPRSKRNCFPEGCRFSVIILTCVRCCNKYVRCFVRKIGPRRVENRAPRAPKWPSGGLRGALGRQFGARWPGGPLRRRSWAALWAVLAALGPLLAPLWAVLA